MAQPISDNDTMKFKINQPVGDAVPNWTARVNPSTKPEYHIL
ncbi:unnamed protein product, partial [Rotaria magnacalcarata]